MQAHLFVVVLAALLAVTWAMPAEDSDHAKIGPKGRTRPPPAPAPRPPARPVQPAKPPPSKCNGIKGNRACVACASNNTCGFNPASNTCVARNTGAPNLITDKSKCQQHGASGSENIKARANEIWERMRSHIFNGEPGGKTDSGRHTFKSYHDANKDAGRCDTQTHICAFRLRESIPKTVWDNRNGRYNDGDIETMCKTAITLNIKDTGGQARGDGAFVVQTKYGRPICVRHQVAGSGSCFPVGIHSRSNRLGSPCREGPQDVQPIAGRNEEVPARP
ncbi:hypothetical protein HGRIS_014766 [Hohenbuehelia grisea]|uniref:Uncharacterized protein n=1 Tax=Hohenbuehelia grisea TaxID=104357 RepID=A0ABR3IQQ6_9AGAR